MDDKSNEKLQNDLSQNAAHFVGKGAANYLGGPVAGEIYDKLSQTEAGKALEQRMASGLQNSVPHANLHNNLSNSKSHKNTLNNPLDSNNSENDNKSTFEKDNNENNIQSTLNSVLDVFNFSTKKKFVIIAAIVAYLVVILVIFLSVFILLGPLDSAINFISEKWDELVGLLSRDNKSAELKYYEELKNVQNAMHSKYGVCIDVNLINATLTVEKDFDNMLEEGEETVNDIDDDEKIEEIDDFDEESSSNKEDKEDKETTKDIKKMQKQIKTLASMQISHIYYGLDTEWEEQTNSFCKDTEDFKYVTADTIENYKGMKPLFFDKERMDSSSPLKISSNDYGSSHSSVKKTDLAFKLYYPKNNTDGTCTKEYARNRLSMLNSDGMKNNYEVSIGSSENYDSVYYWNLINTFIPDYYSDILPEEEEAKNERIKEIADSIYLLYNDIGPSMSCSNESLYAGPSSLCPNGITIDNYGTIDFEEYIAGVVSREAYSDGGEEALKAQAVAARTYALKYTNYCTKAISNSTNAQTFTSNINDYARKAVEATRGEILYYNGEIFSSQYDSFCYEDADCPDSILNDDGTYSVTYTRVPSTERHVITLSDERQKNRITHGQGHAHGMSQLVSYQMAKEGKTYQEILKYFYADGVEITRIDEAKSTDGAVIAEGSIDGILSGKGLSIESFNQYIYSQVKSAGVGTRNGVVAAALSLTSGLFEKTGYILPYELYPSGKYKNYGIDSSWGTNTNRTDYPLNGLDCSGFVSWAIHNGGFKYDVRSAKGWGEASPSRTWSKGTVDRSAQPGDLIYNKPASQNGTTGHIRMIVGVTDNGYVVAEAGSRKVGVRVTEISFESIGNYYLVDMSNYYNNSGNLVNDYPV